MTKILLVEDDKSLREIYGVRLLAEGYDIVSAGDGEEALAMAIKERPNLIISDVMMPKISGFDMLDILRSTTETKDIKVIMMTALSSEDQRARGQALGADKYLVKSQVGIEDVVRTVHEVLKDAPVLGQTPAQTFGGPAPSAGVRPQAPAVPPRPSTPSPQPAPTPAPTFAPTAASMPPRPTPQASSLPQPTAPFSTTRPANLGERVIHPIAPTSGPTDLASRIDQELQGIPAPTALPVNQPQMPSPTAPPPQTAPQPAAQSTPPTPAPQPTTPIIPEGQDSGIAFEEIPRPPAPPTPPAGA